MRVSKLLIVVLLMAVGSAVAAAYDAFDPSRADGSLASLQELHDAGGRWYGRTFGVRYRVTLQERSSEVTWCHAEMNRTRLDYSLEDEGAGHRRIYINDGKNQFSCREPLRCSTTTSLFNDPNNDNLDFLATVFLLPLSSIAHPIDPEADTEGLRRHDLRRKQRVVAGLSSTCFSSAGSLGARRVCFALDGTPLLYSYHGSGAPEIVFTALEVLGDVTDADFVPPYPLGP